MKKIIIYIHLIFISVSGLSQTENIELLKDWQLKGYAKSAERYNDNYTALKFYGEYYKRNKQDTKTAYKVANLYFSVNDFENAKPIFYHLFKADKRAFPKAVFRYGQILKNEKKYDSAAVCFRIYRDELIQYDNKSEKKINLLKAERELEGCEEADFFKKTEKDKINVYALNNSINSAYKDVSPVIWNDTSLIYTSCDIDSMPVVNIETKQNMPIEKYYFAYYKDKTWQGGYKPLKPFFNINNQSVSGGAFSEDGKRFYFSSGDENIYGKKVWYLYVSRLIQGVWSEPEKLNSEINLKNCLSTQPAVGTSYDTNLEVIYFVSDRPGGYGGSDIWYTIYNKSTGRYKKPMNVGSRINSPGNEITPRTDNTLKILYFSSDNHSGYGGFDIYKSFGELVNWTKPENVGQPLNSAFNDFWFTYSMNDSTGFFVSDRNKNKIIEYEHCCYDIFGYEFDNKKTIEIRDTIFETDEHFYENLTQTDPEKKQFKKNSSETVVKLHIKNNENGKYIFLSTDTTDNKGEFSFKVDKGQDYMLTVEKENYTETSILFNTNKLVNNKLNIKPVTIIPKHKKPISLSNIYFQFNKWDLNKKSQQYIDTFLYKILIENKDIVIEISAHTDGIGDENYNLELSKKRAETVANYLIQKGINKSRIVARGFGEARPVASEFTETGEDNAQGRAKNRRIEFRVVGLIVSE